MHPLNCYPQEAFRSITSIRSGILVPRTAAESVSASSQKFVEQQKPWAPFGCGDWSGRGGDCTKPASSADEALGIGLWKGASVLHFLTSRAAKRLHRLGPPSRSFD